LSKRDVLSANLYSIFLVIHGQCDTLLKSYLEAASAFSTSRRSGNCLWLLSEIRSTVSKFNPEHWVHDSLHTNLLRFYNLHQGSRDTNEYHRLFKEHLTTLDLNDAFELPPLSWNADPRLVGATDLATRRKILQAQHVCHMILNACNTRFRPLKASLCAGSSHGRHDWQLTVEAAHRRLQFTENTLLCDILDQAWSNNWRNNNKRNRLRGNQLHASANVITSLSPRALLLDTLASHSLVPPSTLVSDIAPSNITVELQTQGGPFCAAHTGTFLGNPSAPFSVWVDSAALGNILAVHDVANHCHITFDSSADRAMYHPCGVKRRLGRQN